MIGSPTDQDAFQPVVEVPHEEDPTAAPGDQTHLLEVVVVAGHLQAVVAPLEPPRSSLSSSPSAS